MNLITPLNEFPLADLTIEFDLVTQKIIFKVDDQCNGIMYPCRNEVILLKVISDEISKKLLVGRGEFVLPCFNRPLNLSSNQSSFSIDSTGGGIGITDLRDVGYLRKTEYDLESVTLALELDGACLNVWVTGTLGDESQSWYLESEIPEATGSTNS